MHDVRRTRKCECQLKSNGQFGDDSVMIHTLNSIQLAQDCRALDAVVCGTAILKLIIHKSPRAHFQ